MTTTMPITAPGQAPTLSMAQPTRTATRPTVSRPNGTQPAGTQPSRGWAASARTMPRGVTQAAFAQALAQATQTMMPDQGFQGLASPSLSSPSLSSQTAPLEAMISQAMLADPTRADPALANPTMDRLATQDPAIELQAMAAPATV